MLAPTKPVKSCECGSPCGGCCCCTKESIGLGNVDNTSNLNKPLSKDMVNGSVQDSVITTSVLNSYAPMVRTTGNQTISGIKEFITPLRSCITKGRVTDNLDIKANYDGMGIYYLYMNNVKAVKGVPSDIENGGAILYHSREYGWGDSNNNYIYYNQMLISSEGQLYIRRHIQTISKSTNEVTWGTENWRKYNYTTVAQNEGINS